MKIGLDIDGVLYPWHYSIIRYFREFKGYEGDETEFWDMFETLSLETQRYYVNIPIHYLDTSPTTDMLIYVPKLAEIAELYYITARDIELESVTRKFFDLYDLPFKDNLIFEKSKASLVRLLGLDYFVDDQPKYLQTMKGITKTFLFRVPHNRRGTCREEYDNIGSFKELYNIVKGEENERK